MNDKDSFTLEPFKWYAWQMIPGYFGDEAPIPYFSPIFMKGIEPKKTGHSVLRLDFINAMYADGVQEFTINLRILKRQPEYILADIFDPEPKPTDRIALITDISYEWMEKFTPNLIEISGKRNVPNHLNRDVYSYLSAIFTGDGQYHIKARQEAL